MREVVLGVVACGAIAGFVIRAVVRVAVSIIGCAVCLVPGNRVSFPLR